MAPVNKTDNEKYQGGYEVIRILLYFWLKNKIVQTTLENNLAVPQWQIENS